MLEPQTFTPALDAVFDKAQQQGVLIENKGIEYVLLSQKNFDLVLAATNTAEGDFKYLKVPRVDKPSTYILERKVFDELVKLHLELVDLIESAST